MQQKLEEKLGRKVVVRTIAWGGNGFDILYFIVKDLLQHRNVRMIVFYDETHLENKTNQASRPIGSVIQKTRICSQDLLRAGGQLITSPQFSELHKTFCGCLAVIYCRI